MRNMLKVFFSHRPLWLIMAGTGALFYYVVASGLFWQHYYWVFFPIVAAPFIEWLIHKFILHFETNSPDSRLTKYMEKLHYRHHIDPRNLEWVFAPISAVVASGAVIYGISVLLFWSWTAPLTLMAASGVYYLYYEWVHLGHHVTDYHHLTPYGRLMKNAHTWHHYKNENYWWGVTNHLGDVLLGTYPEVNEVEKTGSARSIFDKREEKKVG